MGDYLLNRGEFTMEQNRASPGLQRWETASNGQRGKDLKPNCHGSTPFENVSSQKRPKSSKGTEMTHFKTPGWDRGGKWLAETLNVQWPIEPLIRVTFRDTTHVEAPRASLHLNHSLLITSSSALDTGLAAQFKRLHPLHHTRRRDWPTESHPDLQHYVLNFFENSVRNLWTTWTAFCDISPRLTPFKTLVFYIKIDSFQDPVQQCLWRNVRNWLLSRPLCFTLELTTFKTITVTYMPKRHKLTPFKTLMLCTQFGFLLRPSHFWTQIDSFPDPVQWTIWDITQLTHFKTLIVVYYSISISMGDYLQNLHGRLPSSITLQNTLHSEFQTFSWNKGERHITCK